MPKSYTVLDSGILLATVQDETYTKTAQELIADLLNNDVELIAPMLLRYELIAVVRKWVYRNLTDLNSAKLALTTLLNYPITLHFDDSLALKAYDLATLYQRPTAYDAQYLALAERFSCDFWTADERLFNAVQNSFRHIHWLGTWH